MHKFIQVKIKPIKKLVVSIFDLKFSEKLPSMGFSK